MDENSSARSSQVLTTVYGLPIEYRSKLRQLGNEYWYLSVYVLNIFLYFSIADCGLRVSVELF